MTATLRQFGAIAGNIRQIIAAVNASRHFSQGNQDSPLRNLSGCAAAIPF